MKALVLGAMLLSLLATTASAVVVTLSVGPTVYTENITAPNAARLSAWAAALYPTIPNPAYVTPCGPPLPACLSPTLPNPDPGKTAFQAVIQGIKDNVTNFEREQSKAAVATPAPIN